MQLKYYLYISSGREIKREIDFEFSVLTAYLLESRIEFPYNGKIEINMYPLNNSACPHIN